MLSDFTSHAQIALKNARKYERITSKYQLLSRNPALEHGRLLDELRRHPVRRHAGRVGEPRRRRDARRALGVDLER